MVWHVYRDENGELVMYDDYAADLVAQELGREMIDVKILATVAADRQGCPARGANAAGLTQPREARAGSLAITGVPGIAGLCSRRISGRCLKAAGSPTGASSSSGTRSPV